MKVRLKLILLDDHDLPFIGKGTVRLLQGIERLGSINKSAKEMDMSYVKALKLIRKVETCLGGKILKTKIGGLDHGGAELTPLAVKILELFTSYEAKVESFALEQFEQIKEHLENLGK